MLHNQEKRSAWAHTKLVNLPGLPAALTTAYTTTADSTTLAVGTRLATTNALCKSPGGRNVSLTQVNAGGTTVPTGTYLVDGIDQFGQANTEVIAVTSPNAGSVTYFGSKIFSRVDGITPLTLAGIEAGDTLSVGFGNKVGLPFMFSADLHEIVAVELIANAFATVATADASAPSVGYVQAEAASTAALANALKAALNAGVATQTAKAINTTNFDSTNFACHIAMFAGSLVVKGDCVSILLCTDNLTPDDKIFPAR